MLAMLISIILVFRSVYFQSNTDNLKISSVLFVCGTHLIVDFHNREKRKWPYVPCSKVLFELF